jgi:hypothetical protein
MPTLTAVKSAQDLVDLYYHDLRSHLLEAAAAFDRIERAGQLPADDKRLQELRDAAAIVLDGQPDRAWRFLKALSTDTPSR